MAYTSMWRMVSAAFGTLKSEELSPHPDLGIEGTGVKYTRRVPEARE